MLNKKLLGALGWVKTSFWAFPVLLFVPVILLTAFKISGTSVGVYHQVLYGNSASDPDLLYGMPQPVRSDEWLGGSQLIISQEKNDFSDFNPDLGSGRDVSLVSDLPTSDWPVIFKPQNWSFLFLPLEQAFAFKWWLLSYLLIVTCYFFTLRILPGRRLFAIIFSLAIALSPFVLWWYQSAVSMLLAYGFLILILGIRILNEEPLKWINDKRLSKSIYVLLLTFLLTCFGLILYPPFQIPIALVTIFYLLGYLIYKRKEGAVNWKRLGARVGLLALGAVMAGAILAIFIYGNQDAVHKLNSTRYPGSRVSLSGDLKLLNVFDSFMLPQLQRTSRAAHFFTNQSEASNFILLAPFLIAPSVALIVYDYRRKRQIDWPFVMLQAVILLILTRMFIPFGDSFYKSLFLHKVPNKRLMIGLGFAGIIQMLYVFAKVAEVKIKPQLLTKLALLYGLLCFAVLMWAGVYTVQHYPKFIGYELAAAGAFVLAVIIVLILANKRMLAVTALLLFTILCSFRIMPLYQGLGFIANGEVIKKMESVSPPESTWATVDGIYYENFGILAGRTSITGVQIYPDLKLWEQVGGPQYEKIYNRQGHILLTDNKALDEPFLLVQPNLFQLKFSCSEFILKNIDFLVSPHSMNYSCAKPVAEMPYPKVTFYIYEVVR